MTHPRRGAAIASLMLCLTVCACSRQIDGHATQAALTPQQVFAVTAPGTIQVYGKVDGSDDEYSFGTGFIYDTGKQLALTNAHVVDGVSKVQVRFNDGEQADATVVGRSPCDDLAVLHMDDVPTSAHQLSLGNSGNVQTAQSVFVLGYPGSLTSIQSEKVVFTQGSVQSVHVKVNQAADIPTYPDTIQHSATVNHGNSGGPLVNEHGQVIGINTLSNSGSEGQAVQGQYYSIAISHAQPLLSKLAAGTSIGYAGWNLVPLSELPMADLFPASGFGTADQGQQADQTLAASRVDGMVVTGVTDNTPAADAVNPGDLLTEIDGHTVTTASQVCDALTGSGASGQVPIAGRYLIDSDQTHAFGTPWTDHIGL